MLRITAGKYKNRALKVAEDVTRPFTERMRISVFDLLHEHIEGAHVADLYAGSGAVGIEALSRGAFSATFVESNHLALIYLKENFQTLKLGKEAEIIKADVNYFIKNSSQKFDLIFLDPPFTIQKKGMLFDITLLSKLLTQDGLVILRVEKEQYTKNRIISIGLTEIYKKTYGRSNVIFYSARM